MSNPGIDDWLQTPQGRYVMDWEMEQIDALVVDLPGGGGFGNPAKRDAARVAEGKRAGLL